MKIYNEQKTQEIINPDLEKGYLRGDKILVRTVPAQKAVLEQGHFETIKEYPETGGKDVAWVVDIEGVDEKPSEEIFEDIQVYVPFSDEKIKNIKKSKLRAELIRVKEDIEQVDLFGMERNDIKEKRARAAALVYELRALEQVG